MEEYDDCYCPHGVRERQGMRIDTIWMAICAVALLAIAYVVKVAVQALVGFVQHVGQQTVQFVDKFGFVVLGVIASVLLLLYLIDRIFYLVKFKWIPPEVRAFLKLKRFVMAFFYRKDLEKRFRERPELSELSYHDVRASMSDGHHEGEEPITAEQMRVYWMVYERLKDEQRKTERAIGHDAERIPHRQANKA